MKIALSVPGFGKIDIPSGLPTGTPTGGLDAIGVFIGVAINFASIVAIFFSLYTLFRGAINVMTSGGNKEKIHNGQERVRYALLGLLIFFMSFFIVNLFGDFLGVNLFSFYH